MEKLLQQGWYRVVTNINGTDYHYAYLLADNIYPDYTCFVRGIKEPVTAAAALFSERQSACRKDIERLFGVLLKRFHILSQPATKWSIAELVTIWECCVILHNVITEDEQDADLPHEFDVDDRRSAAQCDQMSCTSILDSDDPSLTQISSSRDYFASEATLRDKQQHAALMKDLIEDLWKRQGRAAATHT